MLNYSLSTLHTISQEQNDGVSENISGTRNGNSNLMAILLLSFSVKILSSQMMSLWVMVSHPTATSVCCLHQINWRQLNGPVHTDVWSWVSMLPLHKKTKMMLIKMGRTTQAKAWKESPSDNPNHNGCIMLSSALKKNRILRALNLSVRDTLAFHSPKQYTSHKLYISRHCVLNMHCIRFLRRFGRLKVCKKWTGSLVYGELHAAMLLRKGGYIIRPLIWTTSPRTRRLIG